MDDYVLENNVIKIDFIKIDIEGAELLALKGGLYSIKKFLPILFSLFKRLREIFFGGLLYNILKERDDYDINCDNEKIKLIDKELKKLRTTMDTQHKEFYKEHLRKLYSQAEKKLQN